MTIKISNEPKRILFIADSCFGFNEEEKKFMRDEFNVTLGACVATMAPTHGWWTGRVLFSVVDDGCVSFGEDDYRVSTYWMNDFRKVLDDTYAMIKRT